MAVVDYMRSFYHEAGFSLLEVLICTMIIILSISLIHIGMKSSDDMLLRHEAIKIISDLRIMQENSHSHFKNNFFSVDRKSVSREFIVYLSDGYYIRENGKSIKLYLLPNGIRIAMNKHSIVFNYDGSCINTTITLKKNNSTVKIIVDTAGRVRLHYGN